MSLLCWMLGLAAYNALTDAEENGEEARRANEANERRIRRLEDELRDLKRERGEWRGRYS